MPLNKNLKKVLVIGSGPITIGQAAEFDYAGTQACRALKEAGLTVVLVNSNPATIMTDNAMADAIYIEPLTVPTIKRIIEKERPDSLLSTLGGQTGLTLSMQLAKEGFLQKMGVALLGANPETIDKAEDRQIFKDTMLAIKQPCIPSKVVTDIETALAFAEEISYPVIVRPAFTLGGSGGGIVQNRRELSEVGQNGLALSPIHQVLIEKCISGWKEIEFEVMRDGAGNAITICSMENVDPVGIHTGDSIVVAPAVTLSPAEFGMLRTAALDIVHALGVEGGCNVQFALHPSSMEYAVIEVNPRVSRSSALASKATGYPIAKVAAKIAIGYRMDEILNAMTGKTYACTEPTVDYIVVKFPRWPFDKFVYAKRTLGTQMKATGEVMSIAPSFEMALLKAVRGAEISKDTLNDAKYDALTLDKLMDMLKETSDERLFVVYAAMKKGASVDALHERTMIDRWFLYKLANLLAFERNLGAGLTQEKYEEGKRLGYPDKAIERISGGKIEIPLRAAYKMVDTCGAEVEAQTPYFYATYDEDDEAEAFTRANSTGKKRVIVFGSGPIRIGQGIEFDYSSVHCVLALKKAGYEVIIVNNNPETVSTDFDTADRLYFEPVTPEDVLGIVAAEKPYGVVVAFGGQTAIKLTRALSGAGVNILGTPADSIDAAEDRERFDALLEKLRIKRPEGSTVLTVEEALVTARKLAYPVLIRPSYVLGGQNMIIAFSDDDIREYMAIILAQGIENPILIDKYLSGIEIEVDAICDGEDILIPGIMEHIERAGVHSGDSIAVYPPFNVSDSLVEELVECSRQLALGLDTRGLVNIQYLIYDGQIYVIEVNPRASRTVPYISKVTGVPMVDLATHAMLGEKLRDMGFGTGLYKTSPYVAVKVPVFSFEKLTDLDTQLGPEMKSTGEVLGIGKTLDEALYKGLIASGAKMEKSGGVFITVRDTDKHEIADVARKFYDLGFTLYATKGTVETLAQAGMPATVVDRLGESDNNAMTLLESGKVKYVISTSSKGRLPSRDSVKIRRKATLLAVPCLTSLDTANALVGSLKSRFSQRTTELVDINAMRTERLKLKFCKMQTCGNDYIYFDFLGEEYQSPESLAVQLCDRHYGIGGDGIVLICRSQIADAKMVMYNMDGSEGKMAGNAIRCVGKYLYDNGIIKSDRAFIETVTGVRELRLYVQRGKVTSVRVNMGEVALAPNRVPVLLPGASVVDAPVKIADVAYRVTCMSLGNPHCVVFMDELSSIDVPSIGPRFENASIFPERVNTEFVKIIGKNKLAMRVWERGNGETLACGTGACAAAVAAILTGQCGKDEDITVKLKGGDLIIRYNGQYVYMTGSAEKVYEGVVEI